MICNTIGLTTDSFETLYVHGGAEVTEVYGSINYAQPIFYSLKTLTGATSYSFMGYPEPLKSYEIGGNMVQNGTPTPTSPIYPQECGDRTANIAPVTSYSGWATDIMDRFNTDYSKISYDSGQYTFSANITTSANTGIFKFCFTYTDDTTSKSGWISATSRRVTLVSTYGKTVKSISITDYNNYTSLQITNIMLNDGNAPLPYEPYGYKIPLNLNGATQNLYLTEPLRKIGDYADEVNSDGTVTRRIKKLVLNGDEKWFNRAGIPKNIFFIDDIGVRAVDNECICTHYENQNYGGFDNIQDNHILTKYNPDANLQRIGIRDSRFSSPNATDFKSYIATQYSAGTPVTVWYVLAEPTTEQVTAPTLTPATGNNTLAIGTTLQPSSVSITGHVKPSS